MGVCCNKSPPLFLHRPPSHHHFTSNYHLHLYRHHHYDDINMTGHPPTIISPQNTLLHPYHHYLHHHHLYHCHCYKDHKNRVAEVGGLSGSAKKSLRAFVERVFKNFRDKNVVFYKIVILHEYWLFLA